MGGAYAWGLRGCAGARVPMQARTEVVHVLRCMMSMAVLVCSIDALYDRLRAPRCSAPAGEIPHTFTAGELTVCVRARRVRPDPYATPTRPGQHPRHPYALAPAANRTLGNVAVLTASATRSDLPPAVLHVQLELLHLQLLAWTSAKYERVLMDNPALDTSAALAGTEASFEALVKRMDFAMDYVLQAVETLRMRPIVRGAAEAALQQV